MKFGVFYGIGVGPGDPELISVKGAGILSRCRHVFVPKARCDGDSTALAIAHRYLKDGSSVHELLFPMVSDRFELSRHWTEAADRIASVVEAGEDACFLTLGDPLLYSTYIYLLRVLKKKIPDLEVVTVPGITAFSAAAALTDFSVGEGRELVTIVPASDDLGSVRKALASGGTVILMKVGKRLPGILDLLEETGHLDQGVFVTRAGQDGERMETNLRRLREEGGEAGYLSIILVHAGRQERS